MINDLIVPVADPRLPFEGRGESGFGVTRGPEGLLAMTRARAISQSRPRRRPYWQALPQSKVDPIADTLQLLHRRRRTARLRALGRLINGLFRRKSHAYEQ
jgi:aldehyde dehydrogenase (NAD+)